MLGKSTLFNAVTATAQAQAANYPFCTIDPNVGCVHVPDERLEKLAKVANSAKIIPTQLEFVDIAGLVRGASQGDGLGNQFLGHIREEDAIIHVLRCFENKDVSHVEGCIDPIRDWEIIETELMLADLESLERRIGAYEKMRQKDPEAVALFPLMEKALLGLQGGTAARSLIWTAAEKPLCKHLHLITLKPVLVAEMEVLQGNTYTDRLKGLLAPLKIPSVLISAAIEAEVSTLDPLDQQAFLKDLGLSETGISRVDLITFFNVGPKEARAWTVQKRALALQAAGVIQSDFERGFICAETLGWQDYLTYGGEAGAKAAGKLRLEGKQYVVCDGDVFHFRFNV